MYVINLKPMNSNIINVCLRQYKLLYMLIISNIRHDKHDGGFMYITWLMNNSFNHD